MALSAKDKKDLANLLWQHKDDIDGYAVQDIHTMWDIFKGSSQIDFNLKNDIEDDFAWEPDGYYLSKDSIYVYKIDGEDSIVDILNGNTSKYFCFC